jgi:hypothetical protein
MREVTLDTNCIIDLKENRPSAVAIRRLMELHQAGRIRLRVVGISASERKRGTYAGNFAEFKEKLAAAGLQDLEILKPMAYLDISFFDWSLLAGDEMEELESKIHEILFPGIEFLYEDFVRKLASRPGAGEVDKTWRNAKCDVQAMWCHIWNGGGVFVTSDDDFHKSSKKTALMALGEARY